MQLSHFSVKGSNFLTKLGGGFLHEFKAYATDLGRLAKPRALQGGITSAMRAGGPMGEDGFFGCQAQRLLEVLHANARSSPG